MKSKIKFSIVIPTRNRPSFIDFSLKVLQKQLYSNFEIIISDNYNDIKFSCEEICNKYLNLPIKYVKPDSNLGMVENWNFALTFAQGDYILYLTDKMFLLPDALLNIVKSISKNALPEIISWVDDSYNPESFSDYFGKGVYTMGQSADKRNHKFEVYSPIEELNFKGEGVTPRNEQSKSDYCRGKICFGAYHKNLVERIIEKYDKLFYDISPDYTSMILALSEAKSAIELSNSGIVHINTDLSNGGQGSIKDDHAYGYLSTLENCVAILNELQIPYLYSCQHNLVAHDYLFLKNRYNLKFNFNYINWTTYIIEDINNSNRIWSSDLIKSEHYNLLKKYLRQLPAQQKQDIENLLAFRKNKKLESEARSLKAQQDQINKEREILKCREANKNKPIGLIKRVVNKVMKIILGEVTFKKIHIIKYNLFNPPTKNKNYTFCKNLFVAINKKKYKKYVWYSWYIFN